MCTDQAYPLLHLDGRNVVALQLWLRLVLQLALEELVRDFFETTLSHSVLHSDTPASTTANEQQAAEHDNDGNSLLAEHGTDARTAGSAGTAIGDAAQ